MCACGRLWRIQRVASMKSTPYYCNAFFQPGRDRKDIGSKMMSSGEADLVDQDVVGALADLGLARERVGVRPRRTPSARRRRHGARSVASWMNFSTPSFIEIEFTTGLPERISGRLR
jgi:hypothetical protein